MCCQCLPPTPARTGGSPGVGQQADVTFTDVTVHSAGPLSAQLEVPDSLLVVGGA